MAEKLTHVREKDARETADVGMEGRSELNREGRLGQLATEQHGVVARSQLISLGFTRRTIDRRLRDNRLLPIHRGVYAVGHELVNVRGRWLAAVLACGEEAALSHTSAAGLWGFLSPRGSAEVTCTRGRSGRRGIRLHRATLEAGERTTRDRIPVTTVARTLFDLAEVVEEHRLEKAFEEADRLNLLQMRVLERVCDRNPGRRALRPIRRLLTEARAPTATRSPLEDRFVAFCRKHHLPAPVLNTSVLGLEIDALWPTRRVVVELDGFSYHRHHAAFQRDRARDATLQVAGYRAIRLTHHRLDHEGPTVLSQLQGLLG
jgi:very-short-patch-repair endonuclease